MDTKEYLKKRLGVPDNQDKWDYEPLNLRAMAVYFNKEEELEHRIELLEIAMGDVQLAIGEGNNKEKATLPINSVSKRFWHFDCWDRTGVMQTITIEALNEENATIIFKAKHEDLGFDPPY